MRKTDVPKIFKVEQSFSKEKVEDIPATTFAELAQLFPADGALRGRRIGVTVGSRGITNIAMITKSVIEFLLSKGAQPFIIPAMGSHGGATAEGQTSLLAHYGVTEETMGVPILADMETHVVGVVDGLEVHCAQPAWDSDGIILVNRIKPHTDFKGRIESGLAKIGAIGIGKLNGAESYHNEVLNRGLGTALELATGELIRLGKVIGGLGIIENAYHDTARLAAVSVDSFMEQEAKLLIYAKDLMPSLPMNEIDVLFVQEMGKNISGTGMDTNILGRSIYGYSPGEPWYEGMPSVFRVIASSLTPESEGNATGMGLADFGTERLKGAINFEYSYLNAITGLAPAAVTMPMIRKNDREALEIALATCRPRPEGPRLVCIKNTLELGSVWVSENCRELVEEASHMQAISQVSELDFDQEGYCLF